MRYAIARLSAALVLLPSAAWAEGCPFDIDATLTATLGEPAATLGAGNTVHTPAGLTMLDLPVSYVIAHRTGEGGAIAELHYRLQGAVRPFGERYPLELRRAFDTAAPGSECGGTKTVSCAVAMRTKGDAGHLSGMELGPGDPALPSDKSAPAYALLEADYSLADGDPVFLVCLYDT
jgi:hypothetical protein